ncbi:MAG: hypothetical protein ACR2QM_07995 [Longimicrobiales bacterium]
MRTFLLGAFQGMVFALLGLTPVSGQTPEALAEQFAQAWQNQSQSAVVELLASDGITLRLEGDLHGGVGQKRVLAALQSYWEERRVADVVVVNVSTMEGGAPRAYGELSWNGVNDMTGEAFGATIFLGLQGSDDGWRIDEIRTITPG